MSSMLFGAASRLRYFDRGKSMKRILLFSVVLILGYVIGIRAQSPQAFTISGGGTHATCQTPVVGSYFLCAATDGIWVSNNGAAYFQVNPPSAVPAGVSS